MTEKLLGRIEESGQSRFPLKAPKADEILNNLGELSKSLDPKLRAKVIEAGITVYQTRGGSEKTLRDFIVNSLTAE